MVHFSSVGLLTMARISSKGHTSCHGHLYGQDSQSPDFDSSREEGILPEQQSGTASYVTKVKVGAGVRYDQNAVHCTCVDRTECESKQPPMVSIWVSF